MKEENYEYLLSQVKYTGFGEELAGELKKKMESGVQQFELNYAKQFGNDKADAKLTFRMSDQGYYFFNKYDLSVKQGHRDTPVRQSFFVVNDKLNKVEGEVKTNPTITFKEAFNLLSGRAVNKDLPKLEKTEAMGKSRYVATGDTYNAWVQLDFGATEASGNFKQKQFGTAYGFDLESALGKYNIKEMQQEKEKAELLTSLRKGNQTAVTFILSDGSEKNGYIEAAPQYKSINTYDEQHKRVRQMEFIGQEQKSSTKQKTREKKQEDDPSRPRRQRKPKGMRAA